MGALLADLEAQLDLTGDRRSLVSLFIGGGTPSLFSGDAVKQLLDGVRERCRLAPDVEITLEANPGAVDMRHFHDYRRAGVNRLSIGVQSLSATHLTELGRIHDPGQALDAFATARAAGFGNVNLDMMFGLPRQTMAGARNDLARLIDLEPEHISYYQLTLEPNTAFAYAPPPIPDEDQLGDMQDQGTAMLADAGYRRYEISAYARPEQLCRHNLNYWCFGDYLGIGAGAHGKVTDVATAVVERRSCRRHPDAYLDDAGQLSTRRRLSDHELILEFAMNVLRLIDGVDPILFQRTTGLTLERIEPSIARAQEEGLLVQGSSRFQASALGLTFLNDLVARFDRV